MLVTRTYHSADCDTDHSLVASKVRLVPKRVHHTKQKPRPRITTTRKGKPELSERFVKAIDEALEDCPTDSATSRWNHVSEAIFHTAFDTFGRKERKQED